MGHFQGQLGMMTVSGSGLAQDEDSKKPEPLPLLKCE